MRGLLSLIYGPFKVDISQRKSMIPTTETCLGDQYTLTLQIIHHVNCLNYDISMAIIMVIKNNVYAPFSSPSQPAFVTLDLLRAETLQ